MAGLRWKDDVDDHDYEAARQYLSLKLTPHQAAAIVRHLRRTEVVERRANDILRSARREPLDLSDPGVHRNLVKVVDGTRLSPVLVVSFEMDTDIADGYHRVSLAYRLTPFTPVALKLATAPHR